MPKAENTMRAVEALYERMGGLVFRRARRFLRDEAAARDACQDIFLRVLQSGGVPAGVAETPWFYRVTTNHCLNVLRGRRRHDAVVAKMPVPEPEPALSAWAVVRDLPEALREIAVYYCLDEMSQDEIAQVMGISQKTVSNRLRELRQFAELHWGLLKGATL